MALRRRSPLTRPAVWALVSIALLAGCGSNTRQLLDQAETSWRKGHYEEAIITNKEIYRRDPRGKYAIQALLNAGNIYYLNLRQLKSAIEAYDQLTREFPDCPEAIQAHLQLAAIYANELVDLDQAIAQYSILLESKDLPNREDILYLRADAYFKKEDFDRARRELNAIADSGVSGKLADQVSLKIGDSYIIQKRFEEAIEPFQKVLASPFAECRRRAILSLEETYENLFEFNKAIETVRMLESTPENATFVKQEVARLTAKSKSVESGTGPEWERFRARQAPQSPTPSLKRRVPPKK